MLAVTPIQTVTGWHWHVVLRRDFGIAMCVIAAPCSDDSKIRRSATPSVVPKPRSSGSQLNLP